VQKRIRFFFFFFVFFLYTRVGRLWLNTSRPNIHLHNWQDAPIVTTTRCQLPNLSGQRRGSFHTLELARAFARIPTIVTTTDIDDSNTTSEIIVKFGNAKA
jgi:hypothetical protein